MSLTVPNPRVQIAFESNAYDANPIWRDVSDDGIAFTPVHRGRMHEMDRMECGTAKVVLKNYTTDSQGNILSQGQYDPGNTDSPYSPHVEPLKRIRVSCNQMGYDKYNHETNFFNSVAVDDDFIFVAAGIQGMFFPSYPNVIYKFDKKTMALLGTFTTAHSPICLVRLGGYLYALESVLAMSYYVYNYSIEQIDPSDMTLIGTWSSADMIISMNPPYMTQNYMDTDGTYLLVGALGVDMVHMTGGVNVYKIDPQTMTLVGEYSSGVGGISMYDMIYCVHYFAPYFYMSSMYDGKLWEIDVSTMTLHYLDTTMMVPGMPMGCCMTDDGDNFMFVGITNTLFKYNRTTRDHSLYNVQDAFCSYAVYADGWIYWACNWGYPEIARIDPDTMITDCFWHPESYAGAGLFHVVSMALDDTYLYAVYHQGNYPTTVWTDYVVKIDREGFSKYGGTLYDGFIESWQPSWLSEKGGIVPIVTLSCVDLFKSLARYNINTSFVQELTGTRVHHVLDAAGWPLQYRDISPGTKECAPLVNPTNVNALDHLFSCAESEGGEFFISRDGYATFYDWNYKQNQMSQVTFSDNHDDILNGAMPFVDIEPYFDDLYIYNEIRVRAANGVDDQVASNAASQLKYGLRSLPIQSILNDDGQAYTLATILLAQYELPMVRAQSITLNPQSNADLWRWCIMSDIGMQITLNCSKYHLSQDFFIEGIEHEWDPRVGLWTTKWQLRTTAGTTPGSLITIKCDTIHGHSGWASAAGEAQDEDWYDEIWQGDHQYVDRVAISDPGSQYYTPPLNPPVPIIIGSQNWINQNHYNVWIIGRWGLMFDTTPILEYGNVIDAYLMVRAGDFYFNYGGEFNLLDGTDAWQVPISIDNYIHNLETCADVLGSIEVNDWVPGAWNIIHLNANGCASINKEGNTWWALRSSQEIPWKPQGPNFTLGAANNWGWSAANFYGSGSADNCPRLVIKANRLPPNQISNLGAVTLLLVGRHLHHRGDGTAPLELH